MSLAQELHNTEKNINIKNKNKNPKKIRKEPWSHKTKKSIKTQTKSTKIAVVHKTVEEHSANTKYCDKPF